MKSALEDLFESQMRDWPLLARGVQGLAHAETRQVRIDWFDVFIRHIPHRIVSTTAAVDKASVETRPCFLCAANLPDEEKGIGYGDYILYYNPFPILERHLSIVHREHRPQRITGQIDAMLDLTVSLPGFFLLYNGAECGASAPDHLHFQACLRSLFPIERDAAMATGLSIPRYSRNVLVFRDTNRSDLRRRMELAIDVLGEMTGKLPEPMVNIAAFYESDRWTVFMFPRGRHRPAVYDSGELTVSPGTIDMCGIIVAPVEKDFKGMTAEDIAKIYREVTLPDSMFGNLVERLR